MNTLRHLGNNPKLLVAGVVMTFGMVSVPFESTLASPAPQEMAAQPEHHCNTGAAAAIGGLLGALAGRGKGHLVGAAIGAGIGAVACTAYNYHVRKLQDAQQVNTSYEQQYGALPTSNTVATYTSTLQPSGAVQPGSDVSLQSTIGVVAGTHDAPPQVSEQLTMLSPDGQSISTATKSAAAINGSGEYQTNFDFNLPKGVKDGQYTLRTTLLMNGAPVRSNDTPMQVVG